MLSNPEYAKRIKVNAEWFSDQGHRELAYTLIESDVHFVDFSEIELEVKKYYPKSVVTEEWLHAVKFESVFVDDIKQSIYSLEVAYIKRQANKASLQYHDYPNQKNRENLEDWLRTMSKMEIEDDEGELKNPTNQLLYELENEVDYGVKTYPKIDAVLGAGLTGGILFILAGRPGTGKTAYAINIALNGLLRNENMFVDYFSLEMNKISMLKRFVSRMTRINSYKFKNAKVALNDEEKMSVIEKADWLNKTNLRIHDVKSKASEIERMIRQRHHDAGDNKYMAIVDYVGLVDAESDRLSRQQEIGKISGMLKRLTNELDIPILLLSQLNRAVENRDSNVPALADLRESGDLEQDANVVGFLYLDDQETAESSESDVNLKIAKNRDGALMTIPYKFLKPETNFVEL